MLKRGGGGEKNKSVGERIGFKDAWKRETSLEGASNLQIAKNLISVTISPGNEVKETAET